MLFPTDLEVRFVKIITIKPPQKYSQSILTTCFDLFQKFIF